MSLAQLDRQTILQEIIADVETPYPSMSWWKPWRECISDDDMFLRDEDRNEDAERFFERTGVVVKNMGNNAYYIETDTVSVKMYDIFRSADQYYITLAHEIIHWTGAASRLDRFGALTIGTLAFEEIVAQLGAVFICADLSIVPPTYDNDAAYVAGWLAKAGGDKHTIIAAATAAETAADFLKRAGGL